MNPTLPTRFLGARLPPHLTLAPSGFLLNMQDGETYSLNETGACLLEALHDGESTPEIWQRLCMRFDVPPLTAQRDAQLFLAELFDLGLLVLPKESSEDVDALVEEIE